MIVYHQPRSFFWGPLFSIRAVSVGISKRRPVGTKPAEPFKHPPLRTPDRRPKGTPLVKGFTMVLGKIGGKGVTLDRSTLCTWVGRACWWLPLHECVPGTGHSWGDRSGREVDYGTPDEPIRIRAAAKGGTFELSVTNGGAPIP
jgi:hypothetical protein